MSALFGFFAPTGLPQARQVAARMARALVKPPGSATLIEHTAAGCLGIVHAPKSRCDAWLRAEGGSLVRAQLGRVVNRNDPEGCAYPEDELTASALLDLRGHFALASLDAAAGRLILATDHFASRPLYLCRYDGVVYFASQLKGVLAAVERRWALNPYSVASMLSFGEMLGDRTLVDGIVTLPAATIRTFGPGADTSQRYWQYCYEAVRHLDWGAAVEATGQALSQAVGRALVHKQNPAVPLSGGLDSRFILELASKSSRPAAYTWGLPGCRDIQFAKMTSVLVGARHQIWYFEPGYLAEFGDRGSWITEGHTPVTNFHVLPFVDRIADQGHDAMLDGFAGDGLLGGNWVGKGWLHSSDFRQAAGALWHWRRRAFCGGIERPLLPEFEAVTREAFTSLYLGYPGRTPMDRTMAFLLDNRVRRTTMCGTEIFRSRLPVWQPFTDVDVLQAFRHVPHAWRKRHRFYLAVFKAYALRTAAAPYQRTLLPARVPYGLTWLSLAAQRAWEELAVRIGLQRPFAGKAPSDFPGWFRGPLRDYLTAILASERCLERGILPADMVRRLLSDHLSGHFNNANIIGALLSLELFSRLFLDDFPGSVERFGEPLPTPAPELLSVA